MVFRRKAYAKLLQWKELAAGTSAVLLEGARRIGKSTIVEEFAKNEYDDYMILDFARENRDVQNLFIDDMDDLDSFFRSLSEDYSWLAGDPAKAKEVLGWTAKKNLEDMCRDSWNWQKNNPTGYGD